MRNFFLLVGVVLAASVIYVLWLPDVAPLKRHNPKTTAYIELRRFQRKFSPRLVWVSWDQISEHLKHAVLIAEDDTFYQHRGVDWDNVRLALAKDWELKRFAYGASTITQQLARNLYLSPSKNPLRKLKEVLIARRLERVLGKRRIFELYLNVVEWGKGVYGAEAAAQAYFHKHACDLTAEEAAAMAAVLPNPRRWNPAAPGPYVERNSRRIMDRMRASGFLPDEPVILQIVPAENPPSAVPVQPKTQVLRRFSARLVA